MCGLRVEVEAKGCFDVLQGLSEGAAEWRGVPAAGVGRQRDAERAIGKASDLTRASGASLLPGRQAANSSMKLSRAAAVRVSEKWPSTWPVLTSKPP